MRESGGKEQIFSFTRKELAENWKVWRREEQAAKDLGRWRLKIRSFLPETGEGRCLTRGLSRGRGTESEL